MKRIRAVIVLITIMIVCILILIGMKYNYRESFTNNDKIIHIYNEYHLGDAMFTVMYFHNIAEYLKASNNYIKFYISPQYHNQIKKFIPTTDHIEILDLKDKPDDAYNIWIAASSGGVNYSNFGESVRRTQNIFAKEYGLPEMPEYSYTDTSLIEKYQQLDKTFQDVDILIINSEPHSGQYHYDISTWNNNITELSKNHKIVTTLKVENVPCTMDNNYTIKDIAAISTKAKYIIAINTGPLVGCFNTYTLNNINKMFVFDVIAYYIHPKIKNVKDWSEISI